MSDREHAQGILVPAAMPTCFVSSAKERVQKMVDQLDPATTKLSQLGNKIGARVRLVG